MNAVFHASELFEAREDVAWAGNPDWLNITFIKRHRDDRESFGGSGIYAIFLDDLLVYLGQFVGPNDNIRGGDIRSIRWQAHLGTLTFRGKKLSIGKRTADELLLDQSEPYASLARSSANELALIRKDQGMVASPAKLAFAAERWGDFSGPITDTLARIRFVYVKMPRLNDQFALSKERMVGLISPVEKELIERYSPPLNTSHNPNPCAPHADLSTVQSDIERCLLVHDHLSPATESIPLSIPDEEAADLEPFEGRLSERATEFLEELSRMVGEDSGFIVYFTKGRTDLRIGEERDGLKNRPWLRMEWRNQSQVFKVWTKLSLEEVRRLGILAGSSTDKYMPSTFEVDPTTDPALLLKVATAAAAENGGSNVGHGSHPG